MRKKSLTSRDREYMVSIFLTNGHKKAVGPSEVAVNMDVSKVGALQKMKRLERCGVGIYKENLGFKLNKKGIEIVEEDIQRHHIIENFLQESLGMDFEDACNEATKLGPIVSDRVIDMINHNYGEEINCECGLCLSPPYKLEDLKECHWCKKMIRGGEDE